MFFYGRYTNSYLLVNYGFCFRDNRYDQIDIYLNMVPSTLDAANFVSLDHNLEEEAGIRRVHLKTDILGDDLMSYLRYYI